MQCRAFDETQMKGVLVNDRDRSLCMYTVAAQERLDKCHMADVHVKHKRKKNTKQHDVLDIAFCKIAASRQ